MRPFGLTLTSLLLVGPALWAQPPAGSPPAPPPGLPGGPPNAILPTPGAGPQQRPPVPQLPNVTFNPATDPLDNLLQQWETRMQGATAVMAKVKRTDIDLVNKQQSQVWDGIAYYLKPDKVRIELDLTAEKGVYEKILINGDKAYRYLSAEKKLYIHELPPPPPGQLAGQNQFGLLFGMKAIEVKRRFDIKLVKQDQWWVYLEVLPRTPEDLADFSKARLVLYAPTMLPRELWLEKGPAGSVRWELPQVDTNATSLVAGHFQPWAPPAGWQTERPAGPPGQPPPPRVVRPQQP